VGKDANPCPVVRAECGGYANKPEEWSVFPDRLMRSVWGSCEKAKGLGPPSLLHVWYWGPGREDRAGVVGHFHQAYNVTIVSSSSVSSMQNLLVSHFSKAQRHPQKNLMSHISHLGFKLRKVSIWYIFPISMSQADCIYIKQEQVSPSLRCVLPLLLFNFLTSSCKCKKWTEG